MRKITRVAYKTGVTVLGFLLLGIGLILLALPGPGILVIILGLLVLSAEYEWASHHLERAKSIRQKALDKANRKKSDKEN